MKAWDFDDAKKELGDLLLRALAHQPQRIELTERQAVVVVNADDFAMLSFAKDLVAFVRKNSLPSDLTRVEPERPVTRDFRADAAPAPEDA